MRATKSKISRSDEDHSNGFYNSVPQAYSTEMRTEFQRERERERERKQTRVPLVDRNAQFLREGKRQRKQPSRVHRSLPKTLYLQLVY